MRKYTTYDFLLDLDPAKMATARAMVFKPYVPSDGPSPFESWSIYSTNAPFAGLSDTFSFTGKLGATYDLVSNSFFDPFIILVYDHLGNVIAVDNGLGDYGFDFANFVAPYTGTYYVSASWDQGLAPGHETVAFAVWQDLDTIVPKTTVVLNGTAGVDKLVTTDNNDTVDGGDGNDTFTFTGKMADYTLARNGGTLTVMDKTEVDGTDTVTNVERLVFTDASISYETSGVAAEVYRLYRAAFDRTPDPGGLGFWIKAIEVHGYSMATVAANFTSSAEFKSLYGAAPSDAEVLTALYRNVLHRLPDQGGFNFWMDALTRNIVTTEDMLIFFSESGENVAQVVAALTLGYTFY
ncbi:MAG: DUF4214 domain-containing protein [Pseudomonadota bacterium]